VGKTTLKTESLTILLYSPYCLKWGALHFRHTYATEYYKQTKDIETLRRILGHSDISTTTIYITLANIDVENGMKSFKGFL